MNILQLAPTTVSQSLDCKVIFAAEQVEIILVFHQEYKLNCFKYLMALWSTVVLTWNLVNISRAQDSMRGSCPQIEEYPVDEVSKREALQIRSKLKRSQQRDSLVKH